MSFCHLHLHSEYSLLDGACRVDDIIKKAKEMGQSSVAVTDHGVMYASIEFYKKAKKAGIKPIIGCEVYVARRTMADKETKEDRYPYHLILLCENYKGYENLCYLVSKGFTDGFYQKMRIDKALMRGHTEGLICLSGCLSGEVAVKLLNDDYEGAKNAALEYRRLFGHDNYYLEVQNHLLPEDARILPRFKRLSRETGIKLVATNDCHYINKEDAFTQKILMCISTGSLLSEDKVGFATEEFYMKSEEEMRALFPDMQEAVDETVKIAERCNVDFTFGELKLPYFKASNDISNEEYFVNKCEEGLCEKYGPDPAPEIRERLNYELGVIKKMGFIDYFLIVADFVNYAKRNKIPVGPGRGSGAGSLCAYLCGITGIDPIKYKLIFERFLNPERVSMPDFDIDFCYIRREEVIKYVVERYGSDNVSQIITFGTLASRAVIRDVGRVMGISYQKVDEIAKKVPRKLNVTIDDAMQEPDFKALYSSDREIKTLVDISKKLEGMPRHASIHAAGVVITRNPVYTYVPLQKGDGINVTQYTMTALEELGLLKMDFLGLRNLTVIDDCQKEIRKTEHNFNIETVNDRDENVFKMLSRGDTLGVFQFESGGMRSVLRQLKPNKIEDLIAVLSLYRPGPMDQIPTYIENRHHPEKITYLDERLKPILEVTNGCIVYQEQVMQIFRELAGFSFGRADLVRRAMAKKKKDVMEEEGKHFLYGYTDENGVVQCEGAIRRGVSPDKARAIFDEMSSFASYAFNKSHAAAYSVVAYETAYLKYYYKNYYMAALLNSVIDFTDKLKFYIEESIRIGLNVYPPNVNKGGALFKALENDIYMGFVAIKGMGMGISLEIEREREKGPFRDIYDFVKRSYVRGLRRKNYESLLKAGAFSDFPENSAYILRNLDTIIDSAAREAEENLSGQLNLFGEKEEKSGFTGEKTEEFDDRMLSHMEREALGFNLRRNPLNDFKEEILKKTDSIEDILEGAEENEALWDRKTVTVGCIVESLRELTTKKGDRMAQLNLEGLTGSMDAVCFPRQYREYKSLLNSDKVLFIKGEITLDRDETKLIINNVRDISQKSENKNFGLYLKAYAKDDPVFVRALEMVRENKGADQLFVYFTKDKLLTKYNRDYNVKITPQLIDELKNILGDKNVAVKKEEA